MAQLLRDLIKVSFTPGVKYHAPGECKNSFNFNFLVLLLEEALRYKIINYHAGQPVRIGCFFVKYEREIHWFV